MRRINAACDATSASVEFYDSRRRDDLLAIEQFAVLLGTQIASGTRRNGRLHAHTDIGASRPHNEDTLSPNVTGQQLPWVARNAG